MNKPAVSVVMDVQQVLRADDHEQVSVALGGMGICFAIREPAHLGQFKKGQQYLVDFTLIEREDRQAALADVLDRRLPEEAGKLQESEVRSQESGGVR